MRLRFGVLSCTWVHGVTRAWKLATYGVGVALIVAALCRTHAEAQQLLLSANLRAGGIDSRQRDQAGSRIRRSHAEVLVRSPAADVTQVLLDYAGYRRFMPNFLASRVLSRRGNQAMVYFEVSALSGLTTLWAEMQIQLLPSSDPTQVVVARMVKGNLKGFEAAWQITPVSATHTLVAFELCADPDFPLPFASGIVSDYNEKEARDSVLALRGHMARPDRSATR